MGQENKVTIEYCSKCKFMMRSAWIAQELLQTFDGDLDEAALRPSLAPGIWQIFANGQLVWDRKTERGLPELKDLKRRVRDIIAPEKDLGHAETVEPEPKSKPQMNTEKN
ncbi:MAG: SelT/SelW/SelH family protein [Pontiella sp.]|nr:SelT/SelW/SelH family protein [Pontiella sp.]MBT8045565.1 SelT/SelW/SelH family protein [Pontiella sp.]NNJ71085.1 SelT/SelW/SelH family protein [Kiritimatiellales bacterium]